MQFRALLITDGYDAHTEDKVRAALNVFPRGIAAIQLRAKQLTGRALFHAAERMRTLTASAGALLLINDRVDIALAVGADGVHLPTGGIPPESVRRMAPKLLVGVSTHSLVEAFRTAGADYITYGPVFATKDKGPPVGEAALAEVTAKISIPVFALGGITAENAARILRTGARIACIGAVLGTDDSAAGARALFAQLGVR